jgi:hypothetical protein
MKVRMTVLSVSLLGLAACASSGGTTSYNSAATDDQYAESRLDNDAQYMARIEQAARRRGVDLKWVNPPRKIVANQD